MTTEPQDEGDAEGSSGSGEQECPQCAEWIKAKARVCRFCRYDLERGEPEGLRPRAPSRRSPRLRERRLPGAAAPSWAFPTVFAILAVVCLVLGLCIFWPLFFAGLIFLLIAAATGSRSAGVAFLAIALLAGGYFLIVFGGLGFTPR